MCVSLVRRVCVNLLARVADQVMNFGNFCAGMGCCVALASS